MIPAFARSLLLAPACIAAAADLDLLVGTWKVEVDDGQPARQMEILRIDEGPGGQLTAAAMYGRLGRKLRPAPVTVERSGSDLAIVLHTPREAVLRVTQASPEAFTGTLKWKNGKVYAARTELLENRPAHTPEAVKEILAQVGGPEEERSDLKPGRTTYRPDASIRIVYMGGNDCPPCRVWRATELPRLQAAPEWKQVSFHYVTKTVASPVPVGWLPEELKPFGAQMLAASSGRGGSSQTAFLVDGKVADYWFGSRSAEEIMQMVHAVRQGKPLPGTPCVRWSAQRVCQQPG